MAVATEVLVFGIITLIIAYFYGQRKPKNFPPGPWGFPVLGHLPLLGLKPHETAVKWKAKYGPMLGLDMGSYKAVIISDYKLVKDAMNEPTFSGRPKTPFVTERAGNGRPEGIILSDGKQWQEQRRFALRRLRDFGFGTRSMEAIVHEEIKELIERFKKTAGVPINTSNKFNVAVVNALWTITAGERLNHDDPKLNRVIELITESVGHSNKRQMFSSFLPWFAKNGPNFLTQYKELMKVHQPAVEFLRPFIESHFKSHDPDHPRDFIDTYITELKNNTDPTSSFRIDNITSFIFTIFDLFLAGAETTSTTLTWICLYMARHQYIQEKLQEEVDRVVGQSRLPSLTDRANMPYTEAVIHEVMRKATLVPLSVFHSTTQDVEFHGYHLPKDTIVLPNLYEIHNNIELWGDPENFRPERFLSKDGTKFERRDGFMAFSTGKRVCLGEGLARDELFLFTSAFFQAFHVNVDPNGPPPTYDTLLGGVVMPKPHQLVLNVRNL